MWLVRRDISKSLRTWVASWIRFFSWNKNNAASIRFCLSVKMDQGIFKWDRKMMFYTDPARHPSLVLVEALDLGQISGGGALHLEALLRQTPPHRGHSQKFAFHRISTCSYCLCYYKHNNPKALSVSMPTPLEASVATTNAVFQGFTLRSALTPHTSNCETWSILMPDLIV